MTEITKIGKFSIFKNSPIIKAKKPTKTLIIGQNQVILAISSILVYIFIGKIVENVKRPAMDLIFDDFLTNEIIIFLFVFLCHLNSFLNF